ncbi:MAG: alpha/beta hydrolase fold domain-containing protein [Betaproteobacteria bacterium]|nr:alpha/beta hydrolase fold domain-containing protein [Betaproteobacteria bacterium]
MPAYDRLPLDPGLAAYYARLNAELGPLPPNPSAALRRERIEEVGRREARPYPSSLAVSDHYLALPGRELPVRLYRPASAAPTGLLVFFHGGGWVIGSLASHDRLAAELAHGSGVAIASVHYRRAPETPFPAPATTRPPRCQGWPNSRLRWDATPAGWASAATVPAGISPSPRRGPRATAAARGSASSC